MIIRELKFLITNQVDLAKIVDAINKKIGKTIVSYDINVPYRDFGGNVCYTVTIKFHSSEKIESFVAAEVLFDGDINATRKYHFI